MPLDPTGPIDPDRILDRSFATVRRGVDPSEVERYLLQLANQMRATATRVQELERELENYRRRPAVIDPIDPANLHKLLGEETTRVLDAAQAAAAEIRARADESVMRMLGDAREESIRLRDEAEALMVRRTAEVEAEVVAIRERGEAERVRAEAEAEAIIDDAKQRGRDMLAEAQQYRQRMLDDLGRRRQALRDQIEQLQAGRDRLAAAYDVVRDTLAVATEELQVALPDDVDRADGANSGSTTAESAAPRLTVVPPVVEPEPSPESAPEPTPVVAVVPEPPVLVAAASPDDPPVAERDDEPDAELDDATDPDLGPEVEPAPVPVPAEARRTSAPVEGRHSSSVRVVRTGRAADVFARLREEGAAEAAATARTTRRAASTEAPEVGDGAGGSDGTATTDTEVADDTGRAAEAAVGAVTDAAVIHAERVDEPVDDRAFLASRDDAVAPIVSSLARRVKRELSDEQNELLATVGTIKGNLSAIALLPTPESQLERYEDIALSALADAAAAGAAIAPLKGRGSSRPSVGDLASDLATSIVGPLRDRLERAVVEAAGDRDDLNNRVRATFREWKSHRIDEVVEFAVLAACSRGILDRLPDSVRVRWVLAEGDVPSPDCEDNSLAEPVPCGSAFPTGHTAPPLHPGCHCVVVPVAD